MDEKAIHVRGLRPVFGCQVAVRLLLFLLLLKILRSEKIGTIHVLIAFLLVAIAQTKNFGT